MPANQPGAVPPDKHGNRSKGRLPFLFGATPGIYREARSAGLRPAEGSQSESVRKWPDDVLIFGRAAAHRARSFKSRHCLSRKFLRTKRRQRLTAALCILNSLVGVTTDDDDTLHAPPAHDADRAHDIRDSHDNTAGDSLRIRTRTPAARPPPVRAHKLRLVPRKLPAAVERIPAPAGRSPLPGASV